MSPPSLLVLQPSPLHPPCSKEIRKRSIPMANKRQPSAGATLGPTQPPSPGGGGAAGGPPPGSSLSTPKPTTPGGTALPHTPGGHPLHGSRSVTPLILNALNTQQTIRRDALTRTLTTSVTFAGRNAAEEGGVESESEREREEASLSAGPSYLSVPEHLMPSTDMSAGSSGVPLQFPAEGGGGGGGRGPARPTRCAACRRRCRRAGPGPGWRRRTRRCRRRPPACRGGSRWGTR